MNILYESTDWTSSLPGFGDLVGDLDTAVEISVTACEYVDDVLVCQTSNNQDPETTEVEQEDGSEPTDVLSLDERQFLSEFFLPIADALADEEVEAWVVPSQYDPMQIAGFFEEPFNADDNFVIVDGIDLNMEDQLLVENQLHQMDNADEDFAYYDAQFAYGYDTDEFEAYNAYEPAVIPLYPRLVKKWRKVPCHQLYQAADPVLLFINEDDVDALADGGMCGMVSSALIIAFLLLFCCLVQKIKAAKKNRKQFSKEKTQRLLTTKEASEAGNYVPPSLKIAVQKTSEKTAGEPHIIFI